MKSGPCHVLTVRRRRRRRRAGSNAGREGVLVTNTKGVDKSDDEAGMPLQPTTILANGEK